MTPKYLFCSRLAYVRRNVLGITQEVAAEKMGIDVTTYAKFERGETSFSIDRLCEFCEVFDIPFEILLPPELLNSKEILWLFSPVDLVGVAHEMLMKKQN